MSAAVESFVEPAPVNPRGAPGARSSAQSRAQDDGPAFADHLRDGQRAERKGPSDAGAAETAQSRRETARDAAQDEQSAETADAAQAKPETDQPAPDETAPVTGYIVQTIVDQLAETAAQAEDAAPAAPVDDAQPQSAATPDPSLAAQAAVENAASEAAPKTQPIEESQEDEPLAADGADANAEAELIAAQAQAAAPAETKPPPELAALNAAPSQASAQPAAQTKADDDIAIGDTETAADAPRQDQRAAAPAQRAENKADENPAASPNENSARDGGERASADAKAPERAAAAQAAPAETARPAAPAQASAQPHFASMVESAQGANPTQTTAADQTATRALPAHTQVEREIIRRFNGDKTSFEVRLDPPELGKVHIRLDVSRDHRVTAVVSADNPQALSDLSRSARDLTHALQSAGLELSDSGLSFDFSQRDSQFADRGKENNPNFTAASEVETAEPAPTQRLRLESWRGGRIDMVA